MNQFFTFMVDWSLKSAATVALGFTCVLLLRRRSAATRHLIWRVTLTAIALLPIAMALTPKQGTPGLLEPIQAPVRAVILPLAPLRIIHSVKSRTNPVNVGNPNARGASGTQMALLVYSIGLFAMLALWLAGYAKARRIARLSTPAPGGSSGYPVLVATGAEPRVPITFGLLKPVIVLPKESEPWPEQRTRAAVLHESAHIARKDWAWQTASYWMRALQWFNPAIWIMNGALHSTSETATDDEVLTQFGMGPTAYAGELLKVAEAARGNLGAAAAMARRGGVAARLKRIVAKGIDRRRPQRRLAIGLGLVFAAGAVLVAAGTVAEAKEGAGVTPNARSARASFSAPARSPAPGDGGAYEAKLSHGGFVRMVAMGSPKAGDPEPLWRPDGRLATDADRTLLEPITSRRIGMDAPDGRVIDFYLQVSNLPMKPDESENGIFRIKQADGWQYRGGTNTSEKDGRLQWDQWVVPANARTCDMDCAISYGAYTLIGRGRFGDGQFDASISDPQGDTANVSVQLPGKFADNQAKLECFDKAGNLIPGGGEVYWGNDDNGRQRFDWGFRAHDAKRIVSFRLSTRQYEHVVIRGIRLPPAEAQP